MDILSSCTFELEDIEIIDHKTENEEKLVKWQCDQCSLFFLEKEKLAEHKKKHGEQETVKCKYCSKKIPNSSENRECFVNRKCETCEYKCSKCPQRFLRHSSLMNHEKKHSSPKKKKTFSVNKANGVAAENIVPSKVLKRKLTEAYDSEEQSIKKPRKILNPKNSPKKKEAINVKAHNSLTIESACNKMSKRMSLKSSKSPEGKSNVENTSSKTPKRISSKTNKLPEEKNSDIKVKHNSITINSTTFPSTSNVTPNSENVVNYKPFSCHVCGDTFASDSALLDHIRTHGESAAKTFQCKFCSDKFDDIYKMQYHLAICPLAEDELESSLKRVIPANIPAKYSGGTSSPRKRGRPKKTKEFSLDQTDNDNESTPFSKRGTFRKRKSEIKEIGEKLQVSSSPVLPKQKKLHQKAPLTGSNSNTTEDDAVVGAIIADVKESEPNGDKKKLHHCPFPRCDFKFTREKALLCHMRNHSDDFEDSLKCHKCDIPFDDIHTLRLHINTCKGIKEERDEDFSRAGCYDSSPNRTSIKAKKDFLCIPCGRSYQNQEKLNRHLESCGSKFVCRICKDDFLNQPLLDEHFTSKHPPNTAYHCYICEEDFISELFLQIHQSDEHGQKLINTQPVKNSVEKTNTESSQKSVQVTDNNDNAKFPMKISGQINIAPSRYVNRIHTSPVTSKTSQFTTSSHLFWCPVCLVGFDTRYNMRDHIKEKHVLNNNRTYSCEICRIKMSMAEMMCYHLELHSTNLLSVNRFSKLISYVKQNRVTEFRSSQVEIKFEKDVEDPTSFHVKETIDVSKSNKDKSTKVNNTRSTIATKKSSVPQNSNSESHLRTFTSRKSEVDYLNSTVKEYDLVKKNHFTTKKRQMAARKSLPDSDTNLLMVEAFNENSELKQPDVINSEKTTRPLRSRVRVNYSLQKKAERGLVRQKVKLEKNTNETFMETTLVKEKRDTNAVMDDLNPTKELSSRRRQGQINKRVRKRKSVSLRKKKKVSLFVDSDIKSNAQSDAEKTVQLVESIKPVTLLLNENKEILPVEPNIQNLPTDNENSSTLGKQQLNENKHNQTHHSLSGRSIENSAFQSNSEDENPREVNLNSTEYDLTSKSISNNICGIKDRLSDLPVNKPNIEKNSNLNFELKERFVQLITQSPQQKENQVTDGLFRGVTEESRELEAIRDKELEESDDLLGGGATNETREETITGNLQASSRKQALEESATPTTSTDRELDRICCTMCTESFANQDELLDHLASHI